MHIYTNSVFYKCLFLYLFLYHFTSPYSNSEECYLLVRNSHLLFEAFKDFSSLTNVLNEGRKLLHHREICSE